MEEPADAQLEETHRWFVDQCHRRFRSVPSEAIADKLIEMTRGADFIVRRAALEALVRRMKNAEDEDLVVTRAAPRGGLGAYVVSRATATGSSGSRARERRPYDVLVEGIAPIRGECGCPDFLKGSLGLCKHPLVALEQQQQGPINGGRSRLVWDPCLPLQGSNDRLLGLRYEPSRRGTALGRWMPGGVPRLADITSPPRRARLLQDALNGLKPARNGKAAIQAGPAVRALLAAELEIAEREAACARASRAVARQLNGLSRPLYPYQLEGVLRFLGRGRLLLADDMGLGKTTQAIAACHALYHSGTIERGLVIAPASH